MKLDDSINWRATIQPGSRLDEAMKAVKIHFPPALTDALQDSYDAAFSQIRGTVSKDSVKINCELVDGVPQYTCVMPMLEINYASKDNPREAAHNRIVKEIESAKQSGQINKDIQIEYAASNFGSTFVVSGGRLEDVMKVACDFYLNQHCPQYAIDYKKIIETGVDDRAADAGQGSWVDRTKGSEGKDAGHVSPG